MFAVGLGRTLVRTARGMSVRGWSQGARGVGTARAMGRGQLH